MTGKLRFGVVSESVPGGPAWLDHVRRVEDGGVDAFLVRDHFSAGAYGQQLTPFSALAAAAAVTARLHVGTLVLANEAGCGGSGLILILRRLPTAWRPWGRLVQHVDAAYARSEPGRSQR